jgi:hypothetical protein
VGGLVRPVEAAEIAGGGAAAHGSNRPGELAQAS